jgi:hypothetical protein
MMVLEITDDEVNDLWDDIESKHPWGPMVLGDREPSRYLLRAWEAGLVSWDNALLLYMASAGIGEVHHGCPECSKAHHLDECPMME